MVLFDVSFPGGAKGLQMRAVQVENRSPPQFAPFPAFNLDEAVSPALGEATLSMCFGSERPHLLAHNGVSAFPGQCTTLSGGMAVTAWATKNSPSGVAGAVWTAANQFHLNFHQVVTAARGEDDTVAASKVWTHGVSGEIASVPAGWEQRTMMYYSGQGINPAVDGWGTTLRQVHKTSKNDAEDLFLQTVSYWTDNGAAGNGVAWKTSAAPPKASHGEYLQLNYTMVDEEHLGAMMESIASSGGVRPRAAQIDCWWYPTSKQHQFYCGTDWVLPAEYYPNGMAGLRETLATPVMMYMPAVCAGGNSIWDGLFNWSDTAKQGWKLPVADEMEPFFEMLFDYGIKTATPKSSSANDKAAADPWPKTWAPAMVKAAWAGTNMAGYETDFFSDLQSGNPESRTVVGKGEMLLKGMDKAAQARNLSVQICGGTVPDFLEALTLPTITNARATNDYDGDATKAGKHNVNSFENLPAPDNAWPFWGLRMGMSKDCFWTSARNVSINATNVLYQGSQVGHDAEAHAMVALLTGVVGIGDWQDGMTNSTLMRRIARSDGILLKADRPLALMDLQLAGMINGSRSLPDTETGARAWSTHITCALESADAPEIATKPTRRLVSHAGYDATLRLRVPDALKQLATDATPFLMWVVFSMNATTTPFDIIGRDLYPLPKTTDHLAVRSFYGAPCVNNADPFGEGGCLALRTDARGEGLFDIGSNPGPCPGVGLCKNKLTYHSIYTMPASPTHPVLLGDLGAYASMSGYRFRLASSAAAAGGATGAAAAVRDVIVVGEPDEVVPVTYLIPHSGSASGWLLKEVPVTVGGDGRKQFAMA
jgi:hypothetical protein